MVSLLKIGHLELSMGNMSHVLGVQKTSKGMDDYLKYSVYQSKFSK